MITLSFKITIAGGLLGASALASAHVGSHAGGDLLHFLSDPQHITVFTMLALAALAVGLRRAFLPRRASQIVED